MKIVIGIISLCLLIVSCEKETVAPDLWIDHGGYELDETIEIRLNPNITDSSFAYQETVPIKGSVSAEINLHGYSLRLKSKTTDSLLFTKDHHTHGNTLEFNYEWQNTLIKPDSLTLTIIVYGNHSGGRTERKIDFYSLD